MAVPNIRIDIASEFRDKGFKQASKASFGLEKQFKQLGKTFLTVFSVAAITKFGKESVRAFKEEELAANRFEQALKGVNLGFATPAIENYLESLERSTAVTKGELRPAFQTLAQTTRSINKSQDILATALDVSAGSGYDLQTVVNDLSRAYLGNNTSLAKYNIGLTKAELRTTRFNDVQELLNKQFAGQKAAQLDTYAGKVAFIGAAYERMQTTVGEGLVDAFGMLAGENGIAGTTAAMEEFGTITADVMRGIGYYVGLVTSQIGGEGGLLNKLQSVAMTGNPLAIALFALQKAGQKTRPLFFPTAGIGQPGIDAKNRAIEEAAIKRQKELEALRLKSIKQQEKINRLKQISQKIDKAASKFDERRIQIAAALQGNISEEERRRLLELQTIEELKQAIQEQDVDKAEKLLERLDVLQSQTETLAETLINLKAGDPFDAWDEAFANINKQVTDLSKINPFASYAPTLLIVGQTLSGLYQQVLGIQSQVAALLSQAQSKSASTAAAVASAQSEEADAAKIAADAAAQAAARATEAAAKAQAEAAAAAAKAAAERAAAEAAAAAAKSAEEKAAADAAVAAAKAAEEAAKAFQEAADAAAAAAATETESVVAAEESAALAAATYARTIEEEAAKAAQEAGVIAAASVASITGSPTAIAAGESGIIGAISASRPVVVINVAGSVIAQEDLVDVVQEGILNNSRSGGGVTRYSETAI